MDAVYYILATYITDRQRTQSSHNCCSTTIMQLGELCVLCSKPFVMTLHVVVSLLLALLIFYCRDSYNMFPFIAVFIVINKY